MKVYFTEEHCEFEGSYTELLSGICSCLLEIVDQFDNKETREAARKFAIQAVNIAMDESRKEEREKENTDSLDDAFKAFFELLF